MGDAVGDKQQAKNTLNKVLLKAFPDDARQSKIEKKLVNDLSGLAEGLNTRQIAIVTAIVHHIEELIAERVEAGAPTATAVALKRALKNKD